MKHPDVPGGPLSPQEQVALLERQRALRLQGLTKDGAARQALAELARRRAEVPPPVVDVLPPYREGQCAVCSMPAWAGKPFCRRHYALIPSPLARAVALRPGDAQARVEAAKAVVAKERGL